MTQLKKSILLIACLAAFVTCLAGFGMLGWGNQSEEIEPSEALLSAPMDMPIVKFASYRMSEGIPLTMTATSVERDLNISILDEDSLPVANIGFEVVVTPPEGDPFVLKDEEATGKIYVDDLEPGEYTLALQETGRFLVPEPIVIEVKAKVERKVIEDIGDKLINAKNVNAASEDPRYGGNSGSAPPPPADTVPFYESKTVEKKVDVPVSVAVYIPTIDGEGYLILKGTGIQPAGSVVSIMATGEDPIDPGTPPPDPTKYRPELNSDGAIIAAISESGERITDIETIKSMFQGEERTVTKTEQKTELIYQGWQTIDGKRYYYNLEGKPVTGSQVIQGMSYQFDSNGVLQQNTTAQAKGIDISTFQTVSNWTQVKNSGVHFAMIRAGYRGYTQGTLIEDDKFKIHAQGAQAAGIKVGLYFFSQALNEREAVEEASAAIAIARKYGISVSYPIAIDIEYINSSRVGRGDWISGAQRTANAKAFCDTIASAGYTPMIYSSKSWFESSSYLDINQLSHYRIWVAHWASQTNYNRSRLDMWQYTSDGTVPGISGRVDMNISYMGY